MEMNLNSVIEKIKKEGVDSAEQEAQKIRQQAEQKAKEIITSAEKQKEQIIKEAEEEAEKLKQNGENALKQAAREVIVSLRTQIIALLDSIIKKEVTEQLSTEMSPYVMKQILVNLVTSCVEKGEFDIEILLSEEDKKNLRGILGAELQDELTKGITIKASPAISKGFRIGKKGKNLYYDFTDEAIAETFNFYLNKKIKEIIDLGVQDAG